MTSTEPFMQRPRDSYAGKATGSIRGASSDFWTGVTTLGAALVGGFYTYWSDKIGVQESIASAVSTLHFIHAAGYGVAAWMGAKGKNILDLAVPLAILQGDNLVRKVSEGSAYSWTDFLADAKPEMIGTGLAYGAGLAFRAYSMSKKKKADRAPA